MTNNIYIFGQLPARFEKVLNNQKITFFDDIGELRQSLRDYGCSLLVICNRNDIPMIDLAKNLSSLFHCYIMLLCSPASLDQAIYQCENFTVFCISKNSSESTFYQTFKIIEKVTQIEKKLQGELDKEKRAVKEEKLISQAKLLLIEKMKFTEQQAHSYIQKAAMDHSITKMSAARIIIDRLQKKQ